MAKKNLWNAFPPAETAGKPSDANEGDKQAFQPKNPATTTTGGKPKTGNSWFKSNANDTEKKNVKQSLFCNFCKRVGHTEDQCYRKAHMLNANQLNLQLSQPAQPENISQMVQPPVAQGQGYNLNMASQQPQPSTSASARAQLENQQGDRPKWSPFWSPLSSQK
ncbi:unnamed protein product [Orchesella dallaii]|uniref:Uncharacterized protein n=1 Tax=Orchesella dallaii TaxID=48710 RepID=A0ABP1QVY0_9HEXA